MLGVLWFGIPTEVRAATPDRYPLCAEVTLAATGPVRIGVPLDLRTAADPEDGSDLVLYDANGQEVPFFRLRGGPPEVRQVRIEATPDPQRFRLVTDAVPIDALRIALPASVPAARVEVIVPDSGEILAHDALIWQLTGGSQREVRLSRPVTGLLEIRVVPTSSELPLGLGQVEGLRTSGRSSAVHEIEVAVDPPIVQENGWARTALTLPRPLPVGAVRLSVSEPIFSRRAGLAPLPTLADPLAGLGYEPDPYDQATISRASIGGLEIEQTELLASNALRQDRIAVLVDARGQVPLDVTGAVVVVPGADLVALDAGPGPHRLCGGARPGTTMTQDLGMAAPEIARLAWTAAEPGPVAANPDWQPPEVRSNLAGPSVPVESARWSKRSTVSGSGLSRIPIPDRVLATARPDLGDLRLLDGERRQVPYLLQREAADRPIEVSLEREERDGISRIAVHLPERGLWVSRIVLRTDATVFERQVTVSRPAAGSRLEPVRVVSWVGNDRPGVLMIEVGRAVDDEILVSIDNGDDPTLPISSVEVNVAGWELVAVLPEGASLWYGDPSLDPPDYDLALLRDELQLRAREVPAAEVGPAETAGKPPLSVIDRLLLAIGVGISALGLLGLALDLVRRLPSAGSAETKPA